jgi:hypothetical protein
MASVLDPAPADAVATDEEIVAGHAHPREHDERPA